MDVEAKKIRGKINRYANETQNSLGHTKTREEYLKNFCEFLKRNNHDFERNKPIGSKEEDGRKDEKKNRRKGEDKEDEEDSKRRSKKDKINEIEVEIESKSVKMGRDSKKLGLPDLNKEIENLKEASMMKGNEETEETKDHEEGKEEERENDEDKHKENRDQNKDSSRSKKRRSRSKDERGLSPEESDLVPHVTVTDPEMKCVIDVWVKPHLEKVDKERSKKYEEILHVPAFLINFGKKTGPVVRYWKNIKKLHNT